MILFATMLRLGLNVASTRVVLLEGHRCRLCRQSHCRLWRVCHRRKLRGWLHRFRDSQDHQFIVITKGAGHVGSYRSLYP